MTIFFGAYDWPLDAHPDSTAQEALEDRIAQAVAAGTANADRIALTVVALGKKDADGRHPWVGLREREVHYSASLLKVAAMYAAFDLRSSADLLLRNEGLTTWAELKQRLDDEWTPDIAARTPDRIRNATGLPAAQRTRPPVYANVLRTGEDADGNPAVVFTKRIDDALDDMIPGAHNPGATTIIRDLGYPYLNAKLADDGFFDGIETGVWLAGDYSGQAPYVRIESVNDGAVAQATTALHLAALFTLMADGRLVGPQSSEDMRTLLGRAGGWFGHTQPPLLADGHLLVTGSKVGVGPLKTGESVYSEGLFIHDNVRDLDFAVVWQNAIGSAGANGRPKRAFLEFVAGLVETAIAELPS
jgi:hypothetical protein